MMCNLSFQYSFSIRKDNSEVFFPYFFAVFSFYSFLWLIGEIFIEDNSGAHTTAFFPRPAPAKVSNSACAINYLSFIIVSLIFFGCLLIFSIYHHSF